MKHDPLAAAEAVHYEHCVTLAMEDLGAWHAMNPTVALDAAYSHLMINSAGLPFTSLVDELARDDARFWADTASLPELECYAVASIDKLRGSAFASRQIKRLIGALWRRMARAEKAEFLEWLHKFEGAK